MQPLWKNGTRRGKLLELTGELQQPRVDGNEQSNAAIDDGDIDPVGELLCMAIEKKMSFPSVAELLKDPCVWIGDTGAT